MNNFKKAKVKRKLELEISVLVNNIELLNFMSSIFILSFKRKKKK